MNRQHDRREQLQRARQPGDDRRPPIEWARAEPLDPEPSGARELTDDRARRPVRRAPAQPARQSMRTRLRQRLSQPETLRETLLLSEILGPPRALRDPQTR